MFISDRKILIIPQTLLRGLPPHSSINHHIISNTSFAPFVLFSFSFNLSLSPASPAELNKLLPFRLCMDSTASVLITLNYSLLPVLPFLTTTSTTKEPFVMHLLQTPQQFITEPPHNSPHLSFKATKTDSTANVLLIPLLVSHSQRQRATAQIAE